MIARIRLRIAVRNWTLLELTLELSVFGDVAGLYERALLLDLNPLPGRQVRICNEIEV